MLATVVLLGLVTVAAATDLLWHKIYNWTTYPGIAAALCLNAVGDVLLSKTELTQRQLQDWGWIGLGQSLLGLLACGLVMMVCYVMFKIGGGDVKLIALIGALLGPQRGIETMLWTFVLGGCMGLIVLIWRVGPVPLVKRVLRQIVYSLRVRGWSPLGEQERAQLQPPLFLAPCALAAVVIVQFALADVIL